MANQIIQRGIKMIVADEAHFLKAHDVSLFSTSLVTEKSDSGPTTYANEATDSPLRHADARSA
jgi:hypothetical protein